uniref:Uncharacterized protein n=1 Tax=Candidatus Kentrum eta TaxID=2126337 RepID=A0A450ULM2_9GAMM|nr:MAG: hypothetical protein BECKH772A_GA0070896_100439 [Candidatus Kentron sp. H]VFJ93435.1 MAG: hypothetical protein BECKH772B_GA0070898_100449 [Candidatus Kentron sp. H]VFK00309.1 MAG: hypothetical protein BECKH772C_GA0070978_100437 [Candidatus Kentron sp. H]
MKETKIELRQKAERTRQILEKAVAEAPREMRRRVPNTHR